MNEKIHRILKEIKQELNVNDDIKISIKNYKRKMASVSLDKKIIRINKEIINDEEILREILYHEILHIKLNTKWHTPEFFKTSCKDH